MRSLSLIGLFSPALVFASSEGVNPSAQDLFHIGGLPISNSIFTTWLIAALIIIAIRLAVGTPSSSRARARASSKAWRRVSAIRSNRSSARR